MKQVVIIGAGGHGREVADIVRQSSDRTLLGYLDDNAELHGKALHGVPVLGSWDWFEHEANWETEVICAVGSPQTMQRLVQRAEQAGLTLAGAISPHAIIAPSAQLGRGVIVFPNVIVNAGAEIKAFCTLNVGVTISHDSLIGTYSNINPGAHIAGHVTVGEGCYIGMSASVIQQRSIGDWTTIGAGAVVIRDVPDRVTAVGVPARIIKGR